MAGTNKLTNLASSLWANFGAMPYLLKLITLNAALGIAFAGASIAVPLDVFGRKVSVTEWWSSGAGPLMAVAMLLPFASAYLMLQRSPLARTLYLSSFAFLALTCPIVAHLTGAEIKEGIPGLVGCLLLIAPLGCYLYLNRSVRGYFGPAGSE